LRDADIRKVLTAAAAISCIGVVAKPNVAEAATYFQASFSGAINPGSANVRAPFNTNGFTQGQAQAKCRSRQLFRSLPPLLQAEA